jgi:RNA polymerase sigma-70 factor (ECF subfamily)
MSGTREQFWWVLRAQSGDLEAFELLLKFIQPSLLRYIQNLVQNRALAEEIVQETLLLIYKKLRWLEDPQLFQAWVYRIASRESWKQLKKEKKHLGEQVPEIMVEPPKDEVSPELLKLLPELVSQVSPASRAVLVLHYLEEMKLSEISEILEVRPGTVKSRLAYGLAKLRENLQKRDYEKK